MATPLRALIVEDSENDCMLLLSILRRGGYAVDYKRVDTAAALKATLDDPWDIIVSDFSMPGFRGTDALAIVRDRGLDVPFIFLSGTIGEDMAVSAMKAGAQDYVIKGNVARLLPAIERELREAEARHEKRQVEHRLRQLEKFEALGKLAGGVAHDFNNVIGAIMGWAEIGADRVAEASQEGKLFRKIGDQARRAAGLTRQLLAYARRRGLLNARGLASLHRYRSVAGLIDMSFFVIAIPVALWSPDLGKVCWAGLALSTPVARVLQRHG